MHVLARVDISISRRPTSKMKARNIYILMGHHPSLFENDAYKTLFHNAILWVADDNDDNRGANPERVENPK